MKPATKKLVTDAPPGLLVEEVAVRLGVSNATVWRMVARRELTARPYYGRRVFDPTDVDRLAKERARAAKAAAEARWR